uniref:hypothetical protein n=1 Tax=Marinimicrobium agarilyticum TaxID=306546 RepID=UPI00055CDB23
TRQRLLTETRELHATNRGGAISMGNTGELRVERLANNGNIDFENLGTVVLDNRNGPVFDLEATDALQAGGTGNANYEQGTLRMELEDGNLIALGSRSSVRPDLVGKRGIFFVDGDIGSASRPLVMYFKDYLFMRGQRSFRPSWAFDTAPAEVEDESVARFSQDLSTAGDQLVEVEGLEEIDPAIFTEVRNYSYDEVSILMPPDQRYGDEEDDDERYSADY